MATARLRTYDHSPSLDVSTLATMGFGEFALLDKLLLLEAAVMRAPDLPDALRATLLPQIAAMKQDIRVLSLLLIGEAPARCGPPPAAGPTTSPLPRQ